MRRIVEMSYEVTADLVCSLLIIHRTRMIYQFFLSSASKLMGMFVGVTISYNRMCHIDLF